MKKNSLPLIALHGAGSHPKMWKTLQNSDLYAFPLSAKNTIQEMAADVTTYLNVNNKSCILIGHSMGALIALEAASHPSVHGVILIGAACAMPVHADLLKQAKTASEPAIDLILKWGITAEHKDHANITTNLKSLMQDNAARLYSDLYACNLYQNGRQAAQNLNKPILVLTGDKDKMTRAEDGQALADICPQAKCITLPHTGHMMTSENPAACTKAIDEFITYIS